MQRIFQNDLKLVPYKVQILPEQTDANKEERSEFCQTISERVMNNPGDLALILFNNEAHFVWVGMSTNKAWGFGDRNNLINILIGY